MTRFPQPEGSRRPVPRFGEGLALVEPIPGLGRDFIRMGGDKCPACGKEVDYDDMTICGHTVTAEVHCECGFRAAVTWRMIDVET